MTIGLLMQGFNYSEMLDWIDEKRNWWYGKVMEYRDEEKRAYEAAKSKSRRR